MHEVFIQNVGFFKQKQQAFQRNLRASSVVSGWTSSQEYPAIENSTREETLSSICGCIGVKNYLCVKFAAKAFPRAATGMTIREGITMSSLTSATILGVIWTSTGGIKCSIIKKEPIMDISQNLKKLRNRGKSLWGSW